MTISSTVRKAGPFASGTTFSFTFRIFKAADIQVIAANALGIESVLIQDTDYTITVNSDQNASPGGAVHYVLPSGYTLVILGNTEYLQETAITNNGGFYPKVIENALDKIEVQVQQLAEISSRAVLVKPTDNTDPAQLISDLKANTTLAVDSASSAKQSETNAATSASAAKASEAVVKASETAAANSSQVAYNSAQTAYDSSQNAYNSALNAQAYAVDANTSKEAAQNNALNAKASETNAKASETAAANSASDAYNSKNDSANSATSAADSAASAASSAAKVNIPEITTEDAEKVLAVSSDLSGFVLKDVTTIPSLANFLALNSAPVGTVIIFAGSTAPTNYLKIPAAATNISRTAYAALFAVIGTTYGVGDGSTTFGLPFIVNGGTAAQGTTGGVTSGVMPSHTHSYTVINYPNLSWGAGVNGSWGMISGTSNGTSGSAGSGSLNLAAGSFFTFAIKYQ